MIPPPFGSEPSRSEDTIAKHAKTMPNPIVNCVESTEQMERHARTGDRDDRAGAFEHFQRAPINASALMFSEVNRPGHGAVEERQHTDRPTRRKASGKLLPGRVS
jgi:hypothetical protein